MPIRRNTNENIFFMEPFSSAIMYPVTLFTEKIIERIKHKIIIPIKTIFPIVQ